VAVAVGYFYFLLVFILMLAAATIGPHVVQIINVTNGLSF